MDKAALIKRYVYWLDDGETMDFVDGEMHVDALLYGYSVDELHDGIADYLAYSCGNYDIRECRAISS